MKKKKKNSLQSERKYCTSKTKILVAFTVYFSCFFREANRTDLAQRLGIDNNNRVRINILFDRNVVFTYI